MSFVVKKDFFHELSVSKSMYCRDLNGNLKHVRQAEERNKTHAHNGCGCGKDLCLFSLGIMAQTTH